MERQYRLSYVVPATEEVRKAAGQPDLCWIGGIEWDVLVPPLRDWAWDRIHVQKTVSGVELMPRAEEPIQEDVLHELSVLAAKWWDEKCAEEVRIAERSARVDKAKEMLAAMIPRTRIEYVRDDGSHIMRADWPDFRDLGLYEDDPRPHQLGVDWDMVAKNETEASQARVDTEHERKEQEEKRRIEVRDEYVMGLLDLPEDRERYEAGLMPKDEVDDIIRAHLIKQTGLQNHELYRRFSEVCMPCGHDVPHITSVEQDVKLTREQFAAYQGIDKAANEAGATCKVMRHDATCNYEDSDTGEVCGENESRYACHVCWKTPAGKVVARFALPALK